MGEENKELIGYCGLYSGDCFGHTGTIADLARGLGVTRFPQSSPWKWTSEELEKAEEKSGC